MPLRERVARFQWRTAASLAAAAAVGAIAVLVVRPQDAPAPAVTPVAQYTATAATAEPKETQYADLDEKNARQLRNYLMAYSQSRARQGVGSTLGYARYTAYTSDVPADQKP